MAESQSNLTNEGSRSSYEFKKVVSGGTVPYAAPPQMMIGLVRLLALYWLVDMLGSSAMPFLFGSFGFGPAAPGALVFIGMLAVRFACYMSLLIWAPAVARWLCSDRRFLNDFL